MSVQTLVIYEVTDRGFYHMVQKLHEAKYQQNQ